MRTQYSCIDSSLISNAFLCDISARLLLSNMAESTRLHHVSQHLGTHRSPKEYPNKERKRCLTKKEANLAMYPDFDNQRKVPARIRFAGRVGGIERYIRQMGYVHGI